MSNDIYGINDELEVFSGYDEALTKFNAKNSQQDWQDIEFASKEEKTALADRMIALWTAYKNEAV